MKIMVFDVPAENGGALSVLQDFYKEFILDKENEYIVVLSLPELKETQNVKVLRFPWVKNSWFHRLYFDYFVAPRLVSEYKVDEVLSLQNVIIPNVRTSQSLFVHNALPFSTKKFSLKESKILWIYQNIIGRKIIHSIRKANQVIVQTNWMKNEISCKLNVPSKKIVIKHPKINKNVTKFFDQPSENFCTFFYPASSMIFKNHQIIIEACLKLKKEGVSNYKVVLTLAEEENYMTEKIYKIVKREKLPIEFIGALEREEVFDFYTKSVLIFPSYIETVGLPLIEAKMHKTPVIVADCLYSKEILKGYEKALYFKFSDSSTLANHMKKYIA